MNQSLIDYYNKNNRNDILLKQEYEYRYSNSIKLPFTIKAKTQEFKSYYNMDSELITKLIQINNEKNKLNELINKDIDLTNFLIDEIIKDEIISTNLIEGVHSSRQDIEEVLKDFIPKGKRVDEYKLIKEYKRLVNENIKVIETNEQLSNLYKELFEELLKDEDKITENNIFRNDAVGVYKGNKLIHPGLNYKDLKGKMNQLVKYMYENKMDNLIVKVAVFHFFFGYYHPFFDGNGRMNRFMTAHYLYPELGICSLFISSNLLKNKEAYYKWFEDTEDVFNKGDMNYFIYNFLNNIYDSIKNFNDNLILNMNYFQKIYQELQTRYPSKNQELKKEIIFYILRGYKFSDENIVTSKELMQVFNKSKSTIKTKLDDLIKLEYINKISKVGKEFIYQLNADNEEMKELLEYE